MFAVPPTPPCRLSQLHDSTVAAGPGVFFNGATGSLVGWVGFTNERAACSLLGRPRVRLFGGPAARVTQRETTFTGDKHAPVRVLRHGHTAGIEIWWSNWCAPGNPGTGKESPPPTGIAVTLPSGGTVRLAVHDRPRCDAPQQPSLVSVGTFELRAGK